MHVAHGYLTVVLFHQQIARKLFAIGRGRDGRLHLRIVLRTLFDLGAGHVEPSARGFIKNQLALEVLIEHLASN